MPVLVAHRGLTLSDSIDDYPEGIILPVDKPYRWTSADVIRKVKYQAIRHFHKKNLKVGHAGTLDPLATGVLLVCIGKATKLAEELQASPKQYLAGVTFGATTPSYDLEKEIDRECPLDGVSEAALRAVLPDFVGEQDQVAPLFSAKSVDGVRAYETARKLFKQGRLSEGSELLQASRITIYSLELERFLPSGAGMGPENCATLGNIRGGDPLLAMGGAEQSEAFSGPIPAPEGKTDRNGRIHVADISGYELPTAMVRVDCSKGTYIRALARDLGEALGSGAFLSSLRRTRNGGIPVEDALSLDEALTILRSNE
jgi:tRNA pseudouridine55 synthase